MQLWTQKLNTERHVIFPLLVHIMGGGEDEAPRLDYSERRSIADRDKLSSDRDRHQLKDAEQKQKRLCISE